MALHGTTLTAAGADRVRAGHPQVPLSDLAPGPALDPGRPVRLFSTVGEPLAAGVADPENELLRIWADADALTDTRAFDAAFFRARVSQALALRQTLGLADGVSAYRLINGEGDGLSGLSADIYGPYVVATALSRGLTGHARSLADAALAVFADAGLPLLGGVIKARLKAQAAGPERAERAKDQIIGQTPPEKLIVRENDVPYEVHLRGGINVGLFSDMRQHRAGLHRFVRGRRVLNTFAYTGALSLAAARAGAASVVSVDLAAGPLRWARENFRLSAIDPEGPAFRWESTDVFRFLDGEAGRDGRYDVIILDPPTVSGAGPSSWAAKRDYPELIAAACALLPDAGGHLWVSANNHRGTSVLKHIDAGLALAKRRGAILELGGLPPDFPTPTNWPAARYLEVCQLRVGER
ncbi:MAG TPA: class I SAM-dependent methyltransferase [Polyangia bacterium]|jgi:23S rRNA (cytosine1962-C5)-methyltransferase|nr:class I SAM-dependent methyltransferase [Polyangia bacterium]